MTNQDIFEKAAIAAMQGILTNSSNSGVLLPAEVCVQAIAIADTLTSSINKNQKYNDLSLEDYIAQVDETHTLIERDMTTRINQLEYKVDYLTQFIEKNYPGWLNKPVGEQL